MSIDKTPSEMKNKVVVCMRCAVLSETGENGELLWQGANCIWGGHTVNDYTTDLDYHRRDA